MKKSAVKIIRPKHLSGYNMPTTIYFGRGQINILPSLIKKSSCKNFLFVAGSHFFQDNKNKKLQKRLESTGKIKFYPKHIKKSTFEEVENLVTHVQKGNYDGVIGLGGGAILDSAKVAAALSVNGGRVRDYLVSNSFKLRKKGIFVIAIPTTSGTGSEVTPWSVVWGDKKYSLSSPEFMFPDIAIVDSALTDDCPKYITATSGIDAMVQAVEAYWNIKHNPTSDKYALESISVILKNLKQAVNDPTEKSRDKMAWGSLTGGLSFSNNSTTLCHSVSYPMTSHWGIAHGQATSITLPMFIEYSFDTLKKREKPLLDAFGAKSSKEAADKVRILIKSVGLKTKLSEIGIPKKGIDVIVGEGFDPTRAGNAPKVPTPEELRVMLSSIF